MTYRLRNILLAVVLAVLAAFLTALYVANYQNRVDAGQEKVKVFVAKSDIPPGTPAEDLKNKVSQKEVLSRDVVPVAVYELDAVKGQTTSQWIYSGEQVSARRFNATGRTGIHAELKGNLRAMAINGNQHQLLAGIVKAGDHVDILVNFKIGSEVNVTRVLLRDIRVLRAAQGGGVDSKITASSSDGAFSAVLQLTDSQAHKLFLATAGNEDHEWWLTLRAPAEATDSPESITSVPSAVRDGLPASQLSRAGQLDENGDN
jgi:Flp pilus assembly protein CpaB